jgi:TonB family protein
MDVVVLRSGIPSTIPGRCIDLGEGGVSAIMAGELRAGESVGLEIKLPVGMEPVQAKAVVRDQKDLLCRLQFVGMRPDAFSALQAWVQLIGPRAMPNIAILPAEKKDAAPAQARRTETRVRRRRQSRKAKWMALSPLILVLAAVLVWWAWQNDWIGLDSNATTSAQSQLLKVPSSIMERSLLHRVEPTYPEEALKRKTEGLVVVDAIIGTDGAVKQVQPLSGPDVLARAAVDAVKWWRFQPYQVNGRPAQVQTTIEVDFQLHE